MGRAKPLLTPTANSQASKDFAYPGALPSCLSPGQLGKGFRLVLVYLLTPGRDSRLAHLPVVLPTGPCGDL